MIKNKIGEKLTTKKTKTSTGLDFIDVVNSKITVGLGSRNRSIANKLFDNRIEHEWLSTAEAAHFLSLSENALRIMVHREQIPVYRFGRRLRFRMADCKALFVKEGV